IQDLSGATGSTVTLGNNSLTVGTANSTGFAGAIGGNGGLTKIGTGTLTLTGVNTYKGGTTVTAGPLAIGHSGAPGGGTVLRCDGTTLQAAANGLSVGNAINLGNTGATIDTQSNGLTLTSSILGNGSITKIGSGTLTLDGANAAYSGATTVAAGTLALLN